MPLQFEGGMITFQLDDSEWRELPTGHEDFRIKMIETASRFLAHIDHHREPGTQEQCSVEGCVYPQNCSLTDYGDDDIGRHFGLRVEKLEQAVMLVNWFADGNHDAMDCDSDTGSECEDDGERYLSPTQNSFSTGTQQAEELMRTWFNQKFLAQNKRNTDRLQRGRQEINGRASGQRGGRGGIIKRARPGRNPQRLTDAQIASVTTGASIGAMSLKESTASGFTDDTKLPVTEQSMPATEALTDTSAHTGSNF